MKERNETKWKQANEFKYKHTQTQRYDRERERERNEDEIPLKQVTNESGSTHAEKIPVEINNNKWLRM